MRSLVRILAIVVVAVMLYPAWHWASSWVGTAGLGSTQFDGVAWRRADPRRDPARADMVRSLVLEHGVLGMRREAVVNLLGEPSKPHGSAATAEFVYDLGWGHGYGFGATGSLVLWFGRDGRVAGWDIVDR